MNKLILGDNLDILRELDSESIDLIYLDPPFFSNRNYEIIWGDSGEVRSFQDRFSGGIHHYIAWLKDRVQELYRILKPTGSIFLHCDWHANAYIRVHILDPIFGINNFRGEIIWKRTNAHNDAKKKLAVLKDTIWYYSKSDKYTYNTVYGGHSEDYKDSFYKHDDNDGKGRYRLDNMSSPNPRPNMMYEWKGFPFPPKGWRYSVETMTQLDSEGRVNYPTKKDGSFDYSKRLSLKRYLNEQKGSVIGDFWDDIQNVQAHAKERIGYPTQKPEALLERIIQMASNAGDVVLDPFVGGGTTVAVADRLGRSWIGIDQSVQAIKVTEFRINAQQGKLGGKTLDMFYNAPFAVRLHKYDYDTLRNKDAFEFEAWIVQQMGGYSNSRQRCDMGIDGKLPNNTPIQVKRSDGIGRNIVDNFLSAIRLYDKATMERNHADGTPIGIIVAFSFGKGAIERVARIKAIDNYIIELRKVEDIVPIAKKPSLSVEFIDKGTTKQGREIEFIAKGTSDNGIEFYAWDFDHQAPTFNPAVLLDKQGVQTHTFRAGNHAIAVKVVDNEGLESIEVIRLHVNGIVSQVESE